MSKTVFINEDELWPFYQFSDDPGHGDIACTLTEEEINLIENVMKQFEIAQEMMQLAMKSGKRYQDDKND